MHLDKIQDPRGKLEKLSRKELEYLGRYEGRTDIQPGMPRLLMLRLFQQQPPAKVPHPQRAQLGEERRLVVPPYDTWARAAFGEPPAQAIQQETVLETDMMADLAKQWEDEKKQPAPPVNVVAEPVGDGWDAMKIWELRRACKERGIPFSRSDKMVVLKEKLRGQNAA